MCVVNLSEFGKRSSIVSFRSGIALFQETLNDVDEDSSEGVQCAEVGQHQTNAVSEEPVPGPPGLSSDSSLGSLELPQATSR